MFLDSFFKNNKVFNAEIEVMQQTKTAGVLGPKEWFSVKTIPVLFWRGSMADAFISAQDRATVSAVAVAKPAEIAAEDIPVNGRLVLTYGCVEVGKFSIVKADNIAGQDAVVIIQLTEYKESAK